jgi:RimJ/RimL family protein N-acetyltransferase
VPAVEHVIRTPRLQLRPLRPGDLDTLAEMYSDAETMAHIGAGETATREETAEWLLNAIAGFERAGYGLMAATELFTGHMVGRCGYKLWQVDGRDHIEIGWMTHRDRTSRGYATEVGIGLRDHAFDVLDLDHVISVIQPANAASIRVAEKVGERYWRDWTTPGGIPVRLYRVDRDDLASGR